jgi:drug/metabolite transporter (DMT)-like permease
VPPRSRSSTAPPLIAALLAVDSLHFVFARLLAGYLPSAVAAFYVLAIAAVEVGLAMGARRLIRPAVFRRHALFFLAIGLLVAFSTTFNYLAVNYIDPGTASLLAQTSVLFALALSLAWLGERLAGRQALGALLAVAGAFAISFQPGDFLRLGSLLVLSSAFLYALHAAIVKRHGGEIDFANFFFFRVASTAGFMVLFTLGRGALVWPAGRAWPLLILVASVDVILSRVLYYLALRRLPMSFHTILLTLSPVITILWSLLLFRQQPTLQSLLGGLAVVAGVAIVTAGARGRQEAQPPPDPGA